MAEGKPKQVTELGGKDGQPIQIIVPGVLAEAFKLTNEGADTKTN